MAIFSGNQVDFATSLWATFRLGAIVTAANPSYTTSELAFQLKTVSPHHPIKILLVSGEPDNLAIAIDAVQATANGDGQIAQIVLISPPGAGVTAEQRALAAQFPTIDDLVKRSRGVVLPAHATMVSGDSKKKTAFLYVTHFACLESHAKKFI